MLIVLLVLLHHIRVRLDAIIVVEDKEPMVIEQHVSLVVWVKNLMVIEHHVYHVHQDKQGQVVYVLFVLMAKNLIAAVLVYLVELVTRV